MTSQPLNEAVRGYWEDGVCGTEEELIGGHEVGSPSWYAAIENHRYAVEPFIHGVAQFTRHRGKKLLEVGVGAGTDHLQWARAGADCHGVDLTDAAIRTAGAHLALHGFTSKLQRVDAEVLPFPDDHFDVVYSWGVIHHSEKPEQIVAEIRRVLKPGGRFIGMMYKRHSLLGYRVWLKHGLLAGRPWRSLSDVLWHHVESVGTKAYTLAEMRRMFGQYAGVSLWPIVTTYDTRRLPDAVARLVPPALGWFIAIHATK